MKNKLLHAVAFMLFCVISANSQDTFSIVAIDTITGEVGSAGASCVDMNNFPGYSDDFLGELFPALGAINTQAWYNSTNQANARIRMNLGDSPSQIIEWLINNDVSGQPQLRQYGIVAFVEGGQESAGHTGVATDDYKNHVLGPNYSIQGNILLGQLVLDSMESRFLNTQGDLACKLMAALQGAKMVGADTRCASNGTSSLFAFVKVAQTDDIFGDPSFLLSVRTSNGDNIEPIDSLQNMFDEVHDCYYVDIDESNSFKSSFNIYPIPANNVLNIESVNLSDCKIELIDIMGNKLFTSTYNNKIKIDISQFPSGIYIIQIANDENSFTTKFIKK